MTHRGSVVAGSGLALMLLVTLLAMITGAPVGAGMAGDGGFTVAAADATQPATAPATAAVAASSEVKSSDGVEVTVDSARWENGYGERFYQVVGRVKNAGPRPLGAVRLRVELLDASGQVVKTIDAWNGRAEELGDAAGAAAAKALAAKGVKPIEPGASDQYRSTFLADETPAFTRQRVGVAQVLPAS